MFYTHCKYNCYDLRLSTKKILESYSTAAIMKRAVENNYYIIVPNTMQDTSNVLIHIFTVYVRRDAEKIR